MRYSTPEKHSILDTEARGKRLQFRLFVALAHDRQFRIGYPLLVLQDPHSFYEVADALARGKSRDTDHPYRIFHPLFRGLEFIRRHPVRDHPDLLGRVRLEGQFLESLAIGNYPGGISPYPPHQRAYKRIQEGETLA